MLRELREIGVDILTLGSTCARRAKHLPVERFVTPDEFAALKAEALAMGFPHVESGPMVRSSYHADGQRDIVLELRNAGDPMIPYFDGHIVELTLPIIGKFRSTVRRAGRAGRDHRRLHRRQAGTAAGLDANDGEYMKRAS